MRGASAAALPQLPPLPPPPLLLLLLLVGMPGSALANFGDTAPADIQISLSAEDLGGKAGEEYPVVDKGKVLPNWVAASATAPVAKKEGGVELENVDSTKVRRQRKHVRRFADLAAL